MYRVYHEEEKLVYLDPVECKAIATEMGTRELDMQCFPQIGRELANEGLLHRYGGGKDQHNAKGKRFEGHGVKRYFWIPVKHP